MPGWVYWCSRGVGWFGRRLHPCVLCSLFCLPCRSWGLACVGEMTWSSRMNREMQQMKSTLGAQLLTQLLGGVGGGVVGAGPGGGRVGRERCRVENIVLTDFHIKIRSKVEMPDRFVNSDNFGRYNCGTARMRKVSRQLR